MGSLVVVIGLFIMSMCICVALSHAQDDFSLTGFDNPRTTVVIINDLEGSLPLRYHCKSKDDDLGDRTMAPRGSWIETDCLQSLGVEDVSGRYTRTGLVNLTKTMECLMFVFLGINHCF
ncbi:hypothetical protein HID58_043901 [Brassica napus]|uniref:S-protein homolog n=1 Tax=Brassica napus TaxID=3708 RepID=A0ABQ8BI73_BRANA|nr:hypothetical protein HID58_043901 [Brassica napus]